MPNLTYQNGRVTDEFNEYCHREGIQATVRMDPRDYKLLIDLVNVGKEDVKVTQGFYTRVLLPGDSMYMKPGPQPKFEEVGVRTITFYL